MKHSTDLYQSTSAGLKNGRNEYDIIGILQYRWQGVSRMSWDY
jgi:hypothetical protein